MKSFDVAVRTADGRIERYLISNAENWMAARLHVIEQLNPPPRCVMVSERSASKAPEPVFRPAA